MDQNFLQMAKERRTIYGIGKDIPVSEDRITEIIKNSVEFTPSAFNSQGSRAFVLYGAQHEKLWDLTKEELRKVTPANLIEQALSRIDSFRAGYGTILFFEDQSIVQGLQQKFPLYKENFPVWSEQTTGILQYIVWVALEQEGLGVSMQHYNPLIDSAVKSTWNIPANWKLEAQMPFGSQTEPPQEKTVVPVEERVKILK